jgi:AraC family transcriptional regulator
MGMAGLHPKDSRCGRLAIGHLAIYWYKFDMSWVDLLAYEPDVAAISIGEHGPGIANYCLKSHWQLHFYSYRSDAEIGGIFCAIHAGSATLTPPGAPMRFHLTRPSRHVYAHVRMPKRWKAPLTTCLVQCGSAFADLESRLRQAIPWHVSEPQRLRARIWDVAWDTWDLFQQHGRANDVIAQALARLRADLASPPSIAALASDAHMTHAHFTRRFRKETGLTPLGYLHAQRAATALQLLQSSALPL